MYYQILFTELKSSHWFLSYIQFYWGSRLRGGALVAHHCGKMDHLKEDGETRK